MTCQPVSFAKTCALDNAQAATSTRQNPWSGQSANGAPMPASVASWQQRLTAQREKEADVGSFTDVPVAVSRWNHKGRQGMAAGQQQPWDKSSATANASVGLRRSGIAGCSPDSKDIASGIRHPSERDMQRAQSIQRSAGTQSHEPCADSC